MFTIIVLIGSYGVLTLTLVHAVFGSWSGIASLGNFCALFFSVPYFIWKAIKLHKTRHETKETYFTWILCVMFPFLFIGFWAIVAIITSDEYAKI